MELFILLAGFFGSWLLFAGPIYQAALELKEEDISFSREAFKDIEKPKSISAWWWLFPPLKVYLEWLRSRKYQKAVFNALSLSQIESFISFRNKAKGWQLVAIGGLCIALKETYELFEYLEWNMISYFIVVGVLVVLSILNTVINSKRTSQFIAFKRAKN
jgi:hypothetical protein